MSPAKRSPFPGLRPFQTEEAHLFHGRREQVNELLQRMAKRRFLAVVTTPASVTIQPYNRLVAELPDGPEAFLERLCAAGAVVEPAPAPDAPGERGMIRLYLSGTAYTVRLPEDRSAGALGGIPSSACRMVSGRKRASTVSVRLTQRIVPV